MIKYIITAQLIFMDSKLNHNLFINYKDSLICSLQYKNLLKKYVKMKFMKKIKKIII